MTPPFEICNTHPHSAICSTGWRIASFDWSQIGAVHIQSPPYYENIRALVSRTVAEHNAAFLPWGADTTVIPLAGAEDVCHVAATLLANPGLPTMTVYPLVSETPTVGEIVGTLGRVIGRTIRYVSITDEQWAEAMKERINPHALDYLTHLWQYYRKGAQGYQSTDTVQVVTGRSPETLEEFFRANIDWMTAGGQ